ncbi:MAG: hypothetical protein KAX76_03270, partial [Comamonas sp.]|nr:hypothetical protein [Comamonas sp.]
MPFTLRPLSMVCLCAITLHAQAQPDAPDASLATVVVTASGNEQDIKDAPASISVITQQELRQRP